MVLSRQTATTPAQGHATHGLFGGRAMPPTETCHTPEAFSVIQTSDE